MNTPRTIELLAPARNADIGIEAIRHGADAVYIGATQFGARADAGNSVADIARLCDYAHTFNARVYVTLNTILYDSELSAAESLVHELYEVGADALIVQDYALLQLDLPPIALHASTQMDTTTVDEARFLEAAGFSQIVVAREMGLEKLRSVASAVNIPIEAFVHGALCVSYSGRCYASEACFQRSANRGRCAQFCRLAFDLVDSAGKTLVRDRHFLSLRDMNRSASIEEMLDAGVSSLKIEGRLKDLGYVKNITAHYHLLLEDLIAHRPKDYQRASHGRVALQFTPQPAKSFNRGFTDYYLHGRTAVDSPDSPKSRGERLGIVQSVSHRSFRLEQHAETPQAGDGLCFINPEGKMEGMRVNRVHGTDIFPARMPLLQPGMEIRRNADYVFDKMLEKPNTSERKLALTMVLSETTDGYELRAHDESGVHATLHFTAAKEKAHTSQHQNIVRQLSRLGTSPFYAQNISVETNEERFLPSSTLSDWRRQIVEALLRQHTLQFTRHLRRRPSIPTLKFPKTRTDYSVNVANHLAHRYLETHGARNVQSAYELSHPANAVLMTCRHCIRYSLGACPKEKSPRKSPPNLALRLPDGRTFPLHFDCQKCEMQVLSHRKP